MRIALADGENYIHAAQRGQLDHIMQIGQKLARGVKVEVFVMIAAKKVAHIIFATQGEHTTETIGMAKGNVDSMIGAKATTMHHQEGVRVDCLAQRQDFVEEIGFILYMALDAPVGVSAPVEKTLGIYAIYAKEL